MGGLDEGKQMGGLDKGAHLFVLCALGVVRRVAGEPAVGDKHDAVVDAELLGRRGGPVAALGRVPALDGRE